MDTEQFSELVNSTFEGVEKIGQALADNPDLIGCLSLEEFTIVSGLVKEYAWVRS